MLTSKDKKALRGKAQTLPSLLTVGKNGVALEVIEAIKALLLTKDLIKISLDAERAKREAWANTIAEATQSQLVGHVGTSFIFYKEKADEKLAE